MCFEERVDFWQGRYKVVSKYGEGRMPDDDKQGDAILHDSRQFIGCVTDAFVMADGHAAIPSTVFQPLLVRAVGRKETVVPLDAEPGYREDFGETLP